MTKHNVPLLNIVSSIVMQLALLIMGLQAQAQEYNWREHIEPPNFQQIEKEVNNPVSRFYYVSLKQKLLRLDSLSFEDTRYLYYGFLFQKEFKIGSDLTKLKHLQNKFESEEMEKDNYHGFIEELRDSISKNPSSTETLALLYTAYAYAKDTTNAVKVKRIIELYAANILLSGYPLSCEKPLLVMNESDETFHLRFLNFDYVTPRRMGLCDEFEVSNQFEKNKKYYFDNSIFTGQRKK